MNTTTVSHSRTSILLVLAATCGAAACSGAADKGPADLAADTGTPPSPPGPSCPVLSAAQPLPMRSATLTVPELPTAAMAYVETGTGPATFVLLHGIPTSSYEWRNVIPELAELGRVIAPDLIGFGGSDRPDIAYSIEQHVAYLGAFLDAHAPGEVILVVHDLGSIIGLVWAARHPERVRGLVTVEGLIPDTIPASVAQSPSGCTATQPDHPSCFWQFMRSPDGQAAILDGNFFIDGALAGEPFCPPTSAALDVYRAAFPTRASREHLASYPRLVPIDGEPAALVPLLSAYSLWLETSITPKLVLYGEPGFLAPATVARRAAERWPATEARSVGAGVHFLPEIQPTAVGAAIRAWFQTTLQR